MLKDTLVFDSEEEYRLTGTLTSPKEIVAVAIERAAMARAGRGWRGGESVRNRQATEELGFSYYP